MKFAKYLPEFGFDPMILTANTFAYEKTDPSMLNSLPRDLHIHRAFALDAKRHLSIKGRYPGFLAAPDRYSTWIPFAIAAGLRLISKQKIDVVFSSSPTLSNHIIANALSKITGKPWVADFRDPAWDDDDQKRSIEIQSWKYAEAMTFNHSKKVTVTTNGMRNLYLDRYEHKDPKDIHVIENGFDYPDFEHINVNNGGIKMPVRFIHAGLLDPDYRDPIPFFKAVQKIKDNSPNAQKEMQIDFIAPGDENKYKAEIDNMQLSDVIHVHSPVPYKTVLQQMADSDILLLFQGPGCDTQVPAKLYEYMCIGKPIMGLTTKTGESARLVKSTNAGTITSIDDSDAIYLELQKIKSDIKEGVDLPCVSKDVAATFSRQRQSKQLSETLHHALNSN